MGWRPTRAIEIVAGTPPGGGLDRSARALLQAIEAARLIDTPVRVVNIGGDGGRKAWAYVDRHPGDAHVFAISAPNLIADYLTGVTKSDPDRYTPLAILYTEYIAFVVRVGSPLRDGAALLRLFGEAPAEVTVALATSLGNSNHVAVAKLVRAAGGDTGSPRIRVFDTALDAVADVVAGNADVGAITAASAVPALAAGTLRTIGVSSPSRLHGPFSEAPTWAEQSVDCIVGSWRGVSGPEGLAPDQVAFWESTLLAATVTEQWKSQLAAHFWVERTMVGSALRDYLRRETVETEAVLRELGLLGSGKIRAV
jgi:putative tricarboxylic transport membrane protein